MMADFESTRINQMLEKIQSVVQNILQSMEGFHTGRAFA